MSPVRAAALLAVTLVTASFSGCYVCAKCPYDSVDGIAVTHVSIPSSEERGAIFSAFEIVAAEAGPESPEVRALDIALAGSSLVIGRYIMTRDTAHVRGYCLLKDGRLALDDRLVRAAPPDADFLKDSHTWPLIPFLYAAGYRLSHGGSWAESHAAASAFAGQLADSLGKGARSSQLPAGVDSYELSAAMRYWQSHY